MLRLLATVGEVVGEIAERTRQPGRRLDEEAANQESGRGGEFDGARF